MYAYDYNMFSLGSICGVAVAFSETVMIFPICDLSFGANVLLKKILHRSLGVI